MAKRHFFHIFFIPHFFMGEEKREKKLQFFRTFVNLKVVTKFFDAFLDCSIFSYESIVIAISKFQALILLLEDLSKSSPLNFAIAFMTKIGR